MTQPNPFGTDMWTGPNATGIIDLDPGMREDSGRSLLSQSLVRRQTTPRGSVIDSPNDCFDVRGWLSDGWTNARAMSLGATIKQELSKDERVVGVSVNATYDQGSKTLTVVESIESSYGPFKLTLAVSAVTVTVLTENQ